MDRKNICQLPLIGLLVLSLSAEAQNLVQNPSFEQYTECPQSNSSIPAGHVSPWTGGGGVQYMNVCAFDSDFGMPSNFLGQQQAKDGLAYIATGLWAYSAQLEMNPVWSELFYPLVEGMPYEVVFYLSLSDVSWYAVKNAGAYFSINPPPSDINSLLNCTPQIRYNENDYLDDKEGWMRISGSFIAQGGERYMTIGNFDGHSGSDALFVGGPQPPAGQPDYYKAAIYYIDDVSVIPDSLTAVREEAMNIISVFPNPVGDVLHIEGERLERLRLFDISGREVLRSSSLRKDGDVDLSHLPQGVYLLELWFEDGRKGVHKVVRSE